MTRFTGRRVKRFMASVCSAYDAHCGILNVYVGGSGFYHGGEGK